MKLYGACKIRTQKFCVEVNFPTKAVIFQIQPGFLSSKMADHKQWLYKVSPLNVCITDTAILYYSATKYSRRRLRSFNTSFTPKHNTLSQAGVLNDAKDFFQLSNSKDKKFRRKHDSEIQKQSVLEEAEKPEPDPKERNMTAIAFSEGLGITAAVIKVFDIDSSNHRIATATQEIMSLFAC
jgi:hypothetical protein